MAGRPLRPATRRRLGRPSPHQQADRPRAHLQPKNLSTTQHAPGSEYPVLAPVSEGYPKAKGRLLTCYSPVRRSIHHPKAMLSLGLHVLSTPPAFVLSQDQTLQQKLWKIHLAIKLPKEPLTRIKIGTGLSNTLLSSQETSTHRTSTLLGLIVIGATALPYPTGFALSNRHRPFPLCSAESPSDARDT